MIGKPGATDTLFLPVLSGALSMPAGKLLFLNADLPAGDIPSDLKARLECEQPWRDRYLTLQRAGFKVAAKQEHPEDFASAFVLCSKHRRENEVLLARALTMVAPGGWVVVAGDKNSGVKSFKKRIGSALEICGSMAKHHGTAFWLKVPACLPKELLVSHNTKPVDGLCAAAGMFSADHADPGSMLLVKAMQGLIHGHVADFGCGWGYLSVHAMGHAITSLTMIDAHYPSLEAAAGNVMTKHPDSKPTTQWLDLETEAVTRRFDTIIMNPPFHTGTKTRRSLGETFIRRASDALNPGGQLLMVANRGLRYDAVLNTGFRLWEEINADPSFRVIAAQR